MNAKRRPDPQEPLPLTPLQRELLAVMQRDSTRSYSFREAMRAATRSGVVDVHKWEAVADFYGLNDRRLIELAGDSPRRCAETGNYITTFKAAST